MFVQQMSKIMTKKIKNYEENTDISTIVEEPALAYYPKQAMPFKMQLKTSTFKNFKKVMDKSPFSLLEWANFLHVSERTLQRYAKDNSSFNGLLIDRILDLEKLIDFGNAEFGDHFHDWLQSTPYNLYGNKPIELLKSSDGIKTVYNLIGQIVHGNIV